MSWCAHIQGLAQMVPSVFATEAVYLHGVVCFPTSRYFASTIMYTLAQVHHVSLCIKWWLSVIFWKMQQNNNACIEVVMSHPAYVGHKASRVFTAVNRIFVSCSRCKHAHAWTSIGICLHTRTGLRLVCIITWQSTRWDWCYHHMLCYHVMLKSVWIIFAEHVMLCSAVVLLCG